MRREYIMTQAALDRLLTACRPVPYLVIGGRPPQSPQAQANVAWQHLADTMGFVWDTVKPVPGKDSRHFTAVPR